MSKFRPTSSDVLFVSKASNRAPDKRRTTLNFETSPSVQITMAANRFARKVAQIYQSKFGIGVTEWRILVLLAAKPCTGVSNTSRVLAIDKAAISRSMRRLEKLGLVTQASLAKQNRLIKWVLTQDGATLHDRILRTSLDAQHRMLVGFSQSEIVALNAFLGRILSNLDEETIDALSVD